MNLIYYPDPILKIPAERIPERKEGKALISEGVTLDIENISKEMIKIMYREDGRGLAGPQVGLPFQIITCIIGKDEPKILINPEIIAKDPNQVNSIEGCLSIPGIKANLNCRYQQIKVKAETINNKSFEIILDLYDAITVQHEIDHLYGITVFERMGSAQRLMRKKKYKKLRA